MRQPRIDTALVVVLLVGLIGAIWIGPVHVEVRSGTHSGPLQPHAPVLIVEPEPGVEFFATSMKEPGPARASFNGRVDWEDGDVVARISKAVVLADSVVDGLETLSVMRLGLAYETESHWGVLRTGPYRMIDFTLKPGETLVLEDIELRVEDVLPGELDKAWPVVMMGIRREGPWGQRRKAQVGYAHGSPDVFEELLTLWRP